MNTIPKLAILDILAESNRPYDTLMSKLAELEISQPEVAVYIRSVPQQVALGFMNAYLAIEAALEKRELERLATK